MISTTETLTSTRTVIPSATWSTFTITPTPTATQPPATNQPRNNLIDSHPHNLLQKLQNNNHLDTFGGFKAKVVEIPRSLPSLPRQLDTFSNLNLDSLGGGGQLDGLSNQGLDSFNSLQSLLSQLQLSHLSIKQQPALTQQLLPLLAQQQHVAHALLDCEDQSR